MSNFLKTTVIGLTLLLSACGGSSDSPEVVIPDSKTFKTQTLNFVDMGSGTVSAINVNADHEGQSNNLFDMAIYGSSENGSFTIESDDTSFAVDFILEDANTLKTLATESKIISAEPSQLIFALGDVNANFYELKVFDKPDIPDFGSDNIAIYVMDLSDLSSNKKTDIFVDSVSKQVNLDKKTLSEPIKLLKNTSDILVEIKDSGTGASIDTCTLTTQNVDRMLIFDADSNCRTMPFSQPK